MEMVHDTWSFPAKATNELPKTKFDTSTKCHKTLSSICHGVPQHENDKLKVSHRPFFQY